MPSPAADPQPTPSPARRRERVREAWRRLDQRRSEAIPRLLGALSTRGRMRKRRMALAFSVGVIGLGTTAHVGLLAAPYAPAAASLEKVAKRKRADELRTSDALKHALIAEEGVRRTVYNDSAGNPTVGVGHLIRRGEGFSAGDKLTTDEVLDLFEADLGQAEEAVARLVGDLPLFQHEFDALVDLMFNVGEGTLSAERSPRLHQAIAAGDYAAIAAELEYTGAGGASAGGLIHRSERRLQMFAEAKYDDPRAILAEQTAAA